MRALILAAGRGTRLGGSDLPKCLTRIGERTLLDRYLDVLGKLQIPVTIVVGHGAEHIREHVAERNKSGSHATSLVQNDRYLEGSIVSLQCGLSACRDMVSGNREFDEDLLLLDGDVAFTESLLPSLAHSAFANAMLVDVGTVFTDEQYMAGINAGRVQMLRRGPADGHEQQGEWVGFAKLSAGAVVALHAAIDAQIASGESRGGYEDALAGLLAAHRFDVVPTDGLPWVEIDFPDDLERALRLFGSGGGTATT
ncbi:MAG: NTP transferase domain-containing protein [Gemmatimonas sp.]